MSPAAWSWAFLAINMLVLPAITTQSQWYRINVFFTGSFMVLVLTRGGDAIAAAMFWPLLVLQLVRYWRRFAT